MINKITVKIDDFAFPPEQRKILKNNNIVTGVAIQLTLEEFAGLFSKEPICVRVKNNIFILDHPDDY
jgi:hypothetical protein